MTGCAGLYVDTVCWAVRGYCMLRSQASLGKFSAYLRGRRRSTRTRPPGVCAWQTQGARAGSHRLPGALRQGPAYAACTSTLQYELLAGLLTVWTCLVCRLLRPASGLPRTPADIRGARVASRTADALSSDAGALQRRVRTSPSLAPRTNALSQGARWE